MRFDWYTAAIGSQGQQIAIYHSDDPCRSTRRLDTTQSQLCLNTLADLANNDTIAGGDAWSQARQAVLSAFWRTPSAVHHQ